MNMKYMIKHPSICWKALSLSLAEMQVEIVVYIYI